MFLEESPSDLEVSGLPVQRDGVPHADDLCPGTVPVREARVAGQDQSSYARLLDLQGEDQAVSGLRHRDQGP